MNYNRRYRRYSRNIGREKALQHIEEARILSDQLGGTDEDVKNYFFELPKNKLDKILYNYGEKYGEDKKEYAIETFNKWKTGKVQMSGLVAGRLYDFLPPTMPLETKYSMVKILWNKHGPKTNKVLKVGRNVSSNKIHNTAKNYLIKTVQDWQVNNNLKQRFKWLSQGDISIQEKLLNHYKDLEKKIIIEGLEKKIPVLVDFINKNEEITTSLNESIKIGNHQLKIKFDLNSEDIEISDPEPEYQYYDVENNNSNSSKFIIGVVVLFILYWLIF